MKVANLDGGKYDTNDMDASVCPCVYERVPRFQSEPQNLYIQQNGSQLLSSSNNDHDFALFQWRSFCLLLKLCHIKVLELAER